MIYTKLFPNTLRTLMMKEKHNWHTLCNYAVSAFRGSGYVCSRRGYYLDRSTWFPLTALIFDKGEPHSPQDKRFFRTRALITRANLVDNVPCFCCSCRGMFHNKVEMQPAWVTNFRYNSSLTKTYEETVAALNGLQSNAADIIRGQKDAGWGARNMTYMKWFLDVLDIKQEDLKSLNAIHVAGTKGKGSTCAFSESILRCSGFKTGFFSSPHLVVVRERIRINGKPLSQSDFVLYFWQVYNKLSAAVSQEDRTMPPYFMFLTIMAFHVFLQKKVDVAVLEVGIGGEYDCTNVISSPAVVGITSIGLDHISLLGDTLQKIAWQKAGILKEGVPAFTVPQPAGVLPVFLDRAIERKCSLYLAPDLNQYSIKQSKQHLNISFEIQEVNMSLALQLCQVWTKRQKAGFKDQSVTGTNTILRAETFEVNNAFETGLQHCIWLGRFQP